MGEALQQPDCLPDPPEGWMTVRQAAAALGHRDRTILRWCMAGKLTAQRCRDGWYIDPRCKPTLWLAAGHLDLKPALEGSALVGMTEGQRRKILHRQALVQAFEKSLADRPAGLPQNEWVTTWLESYHAQKPDSPACQRATLYEWRRAYARKGLAGLCDRRGGRGFEKTHRDPLLWKMFCGLYCRTHLNVRQCHDLVEAEARPIGVPWPSLRTVQRWCDADLPPIIRAAGRNPKTFEDRYIPYVERDWSQVPAMELWIADNRKLDILIRVRRRRGGRHYWVATRPYVQAWIDARSWFAPAWEVYGTEPDSVATAELFAAGVSIHGAPTQALLDNGSGFRADTFSGGRPNKNHPEDEAQLSPIMEELGTKLVRFARPWNHKAKPIEPWFGFVSREFDRLFESYTGYSVATRPGDVDMIPVEKLPTLEQVRQAFASWVTGTFHQQPSPAAAANGLTPQRAFVELREPGRTYSRPSYATLSLLCRASRPVVVTQQGVWVNEYQRHYWADCLVTRQGSGRDAKRKISYRLLAGRQDVVFIFDSQGAFLCVAEPFEGSGMNPLIDAQRNPKEADRLSHFLELQGALKKHFTRKVEEDGQFARNLLLASAQQALADGGRLDKSAPELPAPAVKFNPTLDAAAQATADAEAQAKAHKTARQRAEEFLAGTVPVQENVPPSQAELYRRLIEKDGKAET